VAHVAVVVKPLPQADSPAGEMVRARQQIQQAVVELLLDLCDARLTGQIPQLVRIFREARLWTCLGDSDPSARS